MVITVKHKNMRFVLILLFVAALGVACGFITVKLLRSADENAVTVSTAEVSATETSDFKTVKNATGLTVTDTKTTPSGIVEIPAEIGGVPVTEIGDNAFWGRKITGIIIPEGVTRIGNNVFDGCGQLDSVTLPSTLKSIGEFCFHDCLSLRSITVPDGVEAIGNNAFDGCGITEITLPDSVTDMGEYVFSRCIALRKAHLPVMYKIPEGTFNECNVLEDFTIPEGTVVIGSDLFHDCFKILDVTVPDSVTDIGLMAFYNTKMTIRAPHDPPYYCADFYHTLYYKEWIRTDGQ